MSTSLSSKQFRIGGCYSQQRLGLSTRTECRRDCNTGVCLLSSGAELIYSSVVWLAVVGREPLNQGGRSFSSRGLNPTSWWDKSPSHIEQGVLVCFCALILSLSFPAPSSPICGGTLGQLVSFPIREVLAVSSFRDLDVHLCDAVVGPLRRRSRRDRHTSTALVSKLR